MTLKLKTGKKIQIREKNFMRQTYGSSAWAATLLTLVTGIAALMIVAVLDALAGPDGVVGLGDKVAGLDKIAGRASFANTYYYLSHLLFAKDSHLYCED